ncbi:hypothetical protein ACQKMV_13375 [Lysinibacillus sp. NPDC094403]|uniref:hypothetical protein n=1 Tax=Lysinibacillus sp. NPDC094403 TaxID=3390581 RepID=UPI003D072F22
MRIYNKKKFVYSLLGITLSILSLFALITKGFDLKLSVLTVILFPISLSYLRKSTSKVEVLKEKFEQKDERNQLVYQSSKAISFKVTQYFVIGLEILCIILYSFYKGEMVLACIIILAVIIKVTFLSEIFSGIYYERNL